MLRQNNVIQSTDLDALSSKYSCVKKGYLDDEYIDTIVAGLKGGLTKNLNHSIPGHPSSQLVSPPTLPFASPGSSRLPSSATPLEEHSRIGMQRFGGVGSGNRELNSFIQQFEKAKKSPIINRGTYIRHHAMDQLVDGFLTSVQPDREAQEHQGTRANKETTVLQIISLGSGSDTRPFKVLSDSRFNNVADDDSNVQRLIYHEIDFKESSGKKATTIKNDEKLSMIVGLDQTSHTDNTKDYEIHTENYHLYGLDLRSITIDSKMEDILPFMLTPDNIKNSCNLRTLIISECCLCYLEPKKNSEILTFFNNSFRSSNLGIILYEPMGSNDNFGSVMVENLASRGINLPTLMKYRTIKDQLERFKQLQFKSIWVSNVEKIWYNWISDNNMNKIKKLEFLDEVEEFNLLLNHYCFLWALNFNENQDTGTLDHSSLGNQKWFNSWEKLIYQCKYVEKTAAPLI